MCRSIVLQTISFPTALFLLFLVLKITKAINWRWIWVCSPLWLTIVLPLVALALLAVFIGVALTWMVIVEMLK